jgi:hypothetical protein
MSQENGSEPNPVKIGFKCYEYLGCEIRKEGVEEALLKEDDIKEGDEILSPTYHGYMRMVVHRSEDGSLYGEDPNGRWISPLEFNKDDRHAWVSVGLINPRGLDRLKLG